MGISFVLQVKVQFKLLVQELPDGYSCPIQIKFCFSFIVVNLFDSGPVSYYNVGLLHGCVS